MLLEVKSLNKTYHTGKIDFQALYDINISIDENEFTAIIGPSGSGKTTLLNCMGCIDSTDSGMILLDGEDITKKKSNKLSLLRREYYGFIFQTYNLIPVLTVFENIEMPLRLVKKYSEKEIKQKVYDILEKVELEDLTGIEKRKPLELSGGQQQRVSIARALIKKPKIVLADEPTANLDSKTGENIVNLMQKLNKDEGVTFIFSTHDPLVIKYAKRLIKLRDGKIVKE